MMDHAAVSAARARILSGAAKRIPKASAASCARALGMWHDDEVRFGNEAQFQLMLDLGVFAPAGGHSPALEREAKQPHEGEALEVLRALQAAHFTLFRIGPANPEGWADAQDLLRGTAIRLRDEKLQREEFEGVAFAGRLMRLGGLEWTCGAVAPVTDEVLEELLGRPVRRLPPPAMLPPLTPPTAEDCALLRQAALAADFAPRVYRASLEHGLLGKRQ